MFIAPNELVDRLCDMLRQSAPSHGSNKSRTDALNKAISILGAFDWNEAAFGMIRENIALQTSARAAIRWICADQQRSKILSQQRDELELSQTEIHPSDTFAAAYARNRQLRAALSRFAESCDTSELSSHSSGLDELISALAQALKQSAALNRTRARS
jgi:hypothetical protein